MGTVNKTVSRFGLSEVYTPAPASRALVDIVFVHGLNGDPHNTWTSSPSNVFWPADLLPQFVEEQKARVLVYGYDADVTSLAGSGTTKDKIHNHAERLVADLFANRRIRKATERPIIFVAHSLGGLVVKRALIWSHEITGIKTEHLRSIYISTYGILFLGTPHKGADLASWGSFLEWLCKAVPKKALDTSPQLIDALKTNSETLQNIDRQFAQLIDSFHLYFFHEAKPTDMKGTLRFIVEEDSAAPTLPDVERAGIQADHSHMCKFENEGAPGFDLIVDGIQRYAEDAPVTIETRWNSERAERTTQRIRKAKEIFPGNADSLSIMQTPPTDSGSEFERTPGSSVYDLRDPNLLRKPESPEFNPDAKLSPTKPAEPYFVVPPGFRANLFFVGMEKELLQLDKKVFDKKRRSVGTACVLLHGQAGAGKSHLARQYIYKNRKRFPGGVFWINARLVEEIERDFWQIAQKVVATDSPELRTSGDRTGRSFIDVVRAWFESQHQWLIVLDGVTVDKDQDVDRLQKFIPNSCDSSLIYVSRAKRLETLERLLRPQAIKVAPLSDEIARKLLFKSLSIHHPREAQIKSATDLVKKVGGLPLAIIAISHRIAYTHEPLEKYTIKSYAEDQKIGGRYHEIMDDLQARNHMEAFNLISLLCFYGPHIPVEMVHLGIKALRHDNVEVKSSENGEKPDINSTFGILMRYGLLERNEPDDRESMSSSQSSSLDPEPIDMLKMHTVVQKFCCDSLNAARLLPMWLTWAIRLFCYSYEEAGRRITSRPEQGRVSDYRDYLVHGQRLHEHTIEYESKSQLLGKLRTELEPTLLSIKEEIRHREPGSSQESVNRAEFQISVFDRTSDSSSSRLSDPGARTPNQRPPPLALPNENEFGIPLIKPATDSPRSIGTTSPIYEPRIIDYSPPARYSSVFKDNESKQSYPTQKGAFDSTMRPLTTSDISQGPPWQVVPSFKRIKYMSRGFQRSPAHAELSRKFATGSVTRPLNEASGRQASSSDALTSLARVQHQSPPPSRGSLWSRSSSARSPAPAPGPTTYAGVVAGQRPQSNNPYYPTTSDPVPPFEQNEAQVLVNSERGRARDNLSLLSSNSQVQQSSMSSKFVSPPATEYARPPSLPREATGFEGSPHSSSPMNYILSTPVPSSSSFHPYNATLQTNHLSTRYSPPQISGPNPMPLAYDENITIAPRHPVSRNLQPHNGESPPEQLSPPGTKPDLSNYQYEPVRYHSTAFPINTQPNSGYYSQPVSRIHSNQSQASGTVTEPAPFGRTNISPNLHAMLMDSSSPRLRNSDGSPAHKSPKLGYSQPNTSSLGKLDSPDLMSSSDPAILSGTGGWASNPPLHSSAPRYVHFSGTRSDYSPTAPMYRPMSKTESGPGISVDGQGITEFSHGGQVQFGEFEPTSIAEARRRIRLYEEMLIERQLRGGNARLGAMSTMRDDDDFMAGQNESLFERGAGRAPVGLGLYNDNISEGGTPYPEN